MSGGFLARGVFVQGVFVRGFMSGGFLSGGFCPDTKFNGYWSSNNNISKGTIHPPPIMLDYEKHGHVGVKSGKMCLDTL